jgi:hypothetical protein
MENTHRRLLAATPAEIHPWLLAAWSGGARDVFPRDLIRTWRHNPAGADPAAFVPGVTRLGHGPFVFALREVSAGGWWVDVVGLPGWEHGFTMVAAPAGTLLTHRLRGPLRGRMAVAWPLAIAPLHDWVVEALFDRLDEALVTGAVPATTTRPMPLRVRARFRLLSWWLPRRRRRRAEAPPSARAAASP